MYLVSPANDFPQLLRESERVRFYTSVPVGTPRVEEANGSEHRQIHVPAAKIRNGQNLLLQVYYTS